MFSHMWVRISRFLHVCVYVNVCFIFSRVCVSEYMSRSAKVSIATYVCQNHTNQRSSEHQSAFHQVSGRALQWLLVAALGIKQSMIIHK